MLRENNNIEEFKEHLIEVFKEDNTKFKEGLFRLRAGKIYYTRYELNHGIKNEEHNGIFKSPTEISK